jgi:hypothetical protein
MKKEVAIGFWNKTFMGIATLIQIWIKKKVKKPC